RVGTWEKRGRGMAFVEVNPRYRSLLQQHGLNDFVDFLRLPGVIVSGHPDRNVARVLLGSGPTALLAYLKREHRVPWRDRVASLCAGLGWSSKSAREARVLRALRQAGVGCAEWIAFGEDERGRAFLLLEALPGTVDLQQLLREPLALPWAERHRLACRLGEALARLPAAGVEHPDLCAKHVLVGRDDRAIHFLDWQRSRRRSRVRDRRRCRDLGALDATLAGELATPRERLACLRAYLRATDSTKRVGREEVRRWAR